ncbi:MAG TPA: ATP-binding protein [Candidatus Acidoferrum sp.]|jgi:PAS domain S-box-containing protein|nr:ATP-binding protein [Candidatus Acidoferrum sp.]
MSRLESKQRWGLGVGGILLTLLLAAVFTFGSLDVPFHPKSWREVMVLYAVSSLVTAALLVFLLILGRTTLRLWVERRREQLGARFKTKMVVGAVALSLLPIVFMFIVSYSLINRSLLLWFPKPLEIASEETQKLLNDLGRGQLPRLLALALQVQAEAQKPGDLFMQDAFARGADAVWILDQSGKPVRGGMVCDDQPAVRRGAICMQPNTSGEYLRSLDSGVEVWQAEGKNYFGARVPNFENGKPVGFIVAAYRTSPGVLTRLAAIQTQTREYYQAKQDLRALKRQMLLILLLFTVLLLSSVLWVALFLAKQVTVPIQALAEGTREVSSGNFDYQVPEQAQDELGVLVRSFNTMTTQLRDSRAQIDEFTRSLQQAVQELERRRQLMETVLENIPTGVISLDSSGAILRTNTSVSRMFGLDAAGLESLEELLGADSARTVQHLMRRSLRMGVVSREMETVVGGRVLHLAVTVSSLGPRRANTGFVLVFDDLSELLRSQKTEAWQEVARRIAHEIKNPLTPIQLSAQRLSRFLEKRDSSQTGTSADSELAKLVEECSRLIEREVSTLASLVNEFSQFVRFPAAKLAATNPNGIVREAVEVFSERLDGITLKTKFTENIAMVRADAGLLRSVVVNLIDNAAEALENSSFREITVSTKSLPDAEAVEISVADTGHGISPEDKDKLFLPHFSTKDRGTGLGLAIAARIVAEHGGSIHVEDNFPVGSRFVIELPAADLTPASVADHNGSTTAL